MKRRAVIVGIAVLATAAGRVVAQSGKIPRVGLLSPGTAKEPDSLQREPFERGLRELGWVPGSNVLIDYRYAEGTAARLKELAVELARAGVDVIVARSPVAIHAARQATATIPIVMSATTDDPVADGTVKNLSRPGGNVTGLVAPVFDLDGKRLELMKETFPRIGRVGVLTNPNFETSLFQARNAALHTSARSVKLQIETFEVTKPEEIAGAFAAMRRAQVDAVLIRADRYILDSNWREIAAMAAQHRLPAMHPWRFFVEAGGLMSYGPSLAAIHHRSATYVSRILRGAKPGELAVEQPSKYELVVNLKTAKAMGIEIPKGVLFRADELIQ
jgi:putative ABC transport system substrate-binding protein